MSATGWIDYDTHARTRDRADLWGQVRRTVRGKPVDADQIDLIVTAIVERLGLRDDDVLLDLACGNGALSAQLFPFCGELVGVDISPFLIEVATERFAGPRRRFLTADAATFAMTVAPFRATKALCYGSLSYLSDDDVAATLRALHRRFPLVERVLLGNLPDPDRVGAFTSAPIDVAEPRSDIGVWRSPERIAGLAGPGWTAEPSRMPDRFFAAHYRFDLLLRRAP